MSKGASVGAMIEAIIDKLEVIAPDNKAMIPFTITQERHKWHIDTMVKRERVEYDIHTEDSDLLTALNSNYRSLANWKALERNKPWPPTRH